MILNKENVAWNVNYYFTVLFLYIFVCNMNVCYVNFQTFRDEKYFYLSNLIRKKTKYSVYFFHKVKMGNTSIFVYN